MSARARTQRRVVIAPLARLVAPTSRPGRWRSAMVGRALLLLVGLLGWIAHAVAPGQVALDTGALTLFGLLMVLALAPALRKFNVLGGAGGKFVHHIERARRALSRAAESGALVAGRTPGLAAVGSDLPRLSSVIGLAAVVPAAGLIALRKELSASWRQLYVQLLEPGQPPESDYEVVRALVDAAVVGADLGQAAYEVLKATEQGARRRHPPSAGVRELIDLAGRIVAEIEARAAQPATRRALEASRGS